jgi:hypothetical protein
MVDHTPIGDQFVLPGAERITTANAPRQNNRPHGAKRQPPGDLPLFGDAHLQIEMFGGVR